MAGAAKEGDLREPADLLLYTLRLLLPQSLGQDSLDGEGPPSLLSDSNRLKEWKVF